MPQAHRSRPGTPTAREIADAIAARRIDSLTASPWELTGDLDPLDGPFSWEDLQRAIAREVNMPEVDFEQAAVDAAYVLGVAIGRQLAGSQSMPVSRRATGRCSTTAIEDINRKVFLTPAESADFLGRPSVAAFREWARTRCVPKIRDGGNVMYRRKDLELALEARAQTERPE